VKSLFKAEFEKHFDLEKDAPIRMTLLETKPGKHILGIVAHHLAIDGWSLARLLEHGTHAYNAIVKKEPAPALPWQPYWAYFDEYEQQIAHPGTEKSRAYWKGKEFKSAPLIEKYEEKTTGHRVIYILNKKYYKKVKDLAKANRVTPFLFLMTCFLKSLAKVLKRDNFLISVPIATRDWDQAEFVIGTCVNLMPLELGVNAEGDILADLARVKGAYVDAISHAIVPIQEIQADKTVDLTQLHFNFEPSVEEPELENCEIDFFPYPVSQVEKPIIINVNDTKKTYYIEIDYQFQYLDLMKALTLFTEAERFINKFEALGKQES
jgi:Condensation domain